MEFKTTLLDVQKKIDLNGIELNSVIITDNKNKENFSLVSCTIDKLNSMNLFREMKNREKPPVPGLLNLFE